MTPTLTATCALCRLPAHAPLRAAVGGVDQVFCCSGCRQVFQILQESGQLTPGGDPTQTTLYRQCLEMGLIARPEEVRPNAAQPLSHSGLGSDAAYDATREAAFQIDGMWCGACAWLIENALRQGKGVVECRVLFAADVARITYRPARTSPTELVKSIRRLGYSASPLGGDDAGQSAGKTDERRAGLFRAVVAVVFAMTAMMYQIGLYYGEWHHIGASGEMVDALGAGVMSLPILWAGWPLFRRAWAAARAATATMETLITLGAGTAFGFSAWALAHRDISHVYFDTAGMLVALTLVGKSLEAGAKGQATGAVTLLYGLLPRKATLITPDGGEALAATDNLRPGDRILARPGERIAADGVVVSGVGSVDESVLTGESRPVRKQPTDSVTGGTVALDAPLTIEVMRVGPDSTVVRMIALVESALAAKTSAERWADGIARRFVPGILLLAAATGIALALTHHAPDVVMARVVAVLVIACPCALALATPLAMTTAVGAAAARGILFTNPNVLETLPQVRHLLLDKTGTLTEGRFAVRATVALPGVGADDDISALAALESPSEHPLARALVAYAAQEGAAGTFPRPHVTEFTRVPGGGVTGRVNGEFWWIGNRRLAEARGASVPESLADEAAQHECAGLTALYYGAGEPGRLHGLIALGDAVRPGAAAAVRRLTALGLTLELLSGDATGTTEAVARAVGIEAVAARMLPEDKAARIKAVSSGAERTRVAFCGDGINDAPGLAQADVGIAFGSGTEIARRASDIVLVGDDICRLADLFVLSRAASRTLRQNLAWACCYNAVCVPAAILGYVHPLVAAAAMLVSSLSVVLNSRRLRRRLERDSGG